MVRYSIVIGILLVLLGVGAYGLIAAVSGEAPSATALIPAFAGAPILLLGLLSLRSSFRTRGMRVVFALAGLGFALPSARLAMQLTQGAELKMTATASLVLMAALCGTLLLLGVKSFIGPRAAAPQKA